MPAPYPTQPSQLNKVQTAIDQTVPMTAAELVELRKALNERQLAGRENITGAPPPKPVTSVEVLDISPGATPPMVRLTVGEATTLSFADSAGRPWPIVDNVNANGRAYEARLIGLHLYNVTLKNREPANLTIVLKDLPRPIVITAVPATTETDYLKEYTVPKFLDGKPPVAAVAASSSGSLGFNAPELLDYLYRTPPKAARALQVMGLQGVSAWQTAGSKMVIRTDGQVVILAFTRRHGATDGFAVFEVPLSPMVTISQAGTLHRVSIAGFVVESAATTAKATQ